ncbi:MAG TPA: hypothetical protein VFT13_09065 [Candidatus Krumholzibacteria bacterium]|nr:hypothetical protein [Candidatus Krumholzibacteria bacterium]
MITPRPWNRALSLATVVALGACASAPGDAGFSTVQQAVKKQSGHDLIWSGPGGEETVEVMRPAPDRPLAADDAVELALFNNRSLQASLESLGIARADLIEAGTLHNPTLEARVRWSSHVSSANPEMALLFDVTDLVRRGKRKAVASDTGMDGLQS